MKIPACCFQLLERSHVENTGTESYVHAHVRANRYLAIALISMVNHTRYDWTVTCACYA